jgi:predicted metal-dependent phosphoesterase TrpH
MPSKPIPLLCELHAHTTWSDGDLTVQELCDLYGRRGFDVLAVTDHTIRIHTEVTAELFDEYLAEIGAEAERARTLYGLVVLPGLELTWDDPDPMQSAHAVAVGLDRFVDLTTHSLESALAAARAQGAALVAAHPYSPDSLADATRGTAAFAARTGELAPLVDRFELFNRQTLFGWVAAAGLPGVATGDFHRVEHLRTWKTLLPCVKQPEAVIDYLRSKRPAFLVALDETAVPVAAALAA